MARTRRPRRSQTTRRSFRVYGWIPDLPDQRDYLYSTRFRIPPELPEHVDLRPFCSRVENQGALGSCTAQALTGAMEVLEKKDAVPFQDLSRLFLYYNERVIIGTVGYDSGATLRDGIKSLAREGVCAERRWPYVIARFKKKPGAVCYREAADHQITSYHRMLALDEMQACLAEGFPFVFGFAVYESFESTEVTRTGVVQMPEKAERVLGGHAVLAVGYSMPDKRFLVRNSWGTRWGQRGYFTMPFAYLEDRSLSDDFWTIRRGENM